MNSFERRKYICLKILKQYRAEELLSAFLGKKNHTHNITKGNKRNYFYAYISTSGSPRTLLSSQADVRVLWTLVSNSIKLVG